MQASRLARSSKEPEEEGACNADVGSFKEEEKDLPLNEEEEHLQPAWFDTAQVFQQPLNCLPQQKLQQQQQQQQQPAHLAPGSAAEKHRCVSVDYTMHLPLI